MATAENPGRTHADVRPGDPGWTGGTVLSDVRRASTTASPEVLFAQVTAVGGERGWPTYRLLWEIRGLVDRLVGGPGLRRGRRHPQDLRVGDELDFWRVEALYPPDEHGTALLRLRAEMRVPGPAWLEFAIAPGLGDTTVLTQRALFVPTGLWGRLYWLAMLPFHPLIFASMVRALARQAEQRNPATSSGALTAQPVGPGAPGEPPGHEQPPSREAG
jgi:hypothetical protein